MLIFDLLQVVCICLYAYTHTFVYEKVLSCARVRVRLCVCVQMNLRKSFALFICSAQLFLPFPELTFLYSILSS